MRKIVLNLAVTLDGFIEGPNGEIDWCALDGESDAFFDKFLPEVDSIFYGRVSYDLWGQYQPPDTASASEKKLWSIVHSKEKYVFSRKPSPDKNVTYIADNIAERVMEIKQQPGKNIWLYGGAKLISYFVNENLVDNYLLAVFPVLLGSGKPLFQNITGRLTLRLNSIEHSSSGVLLLNYEAKR